MPGPDDGSGFDRPCDVDLGLDHQLWWIGWWPDRRYNPQFEGIPDEPRYAAYIVHKKPDGSKCAGCVTLDHPTHVTLAGLKWKIESMDPLTLSPSLLCACGDHGFIREGRWVPA